MICVKTRAAETEADHFDLFVTEALEWPLAYMACHWHPWLPGAEKQFHNVSQSSTVRQLDHLSLSGTSGGCWCSCSSERWRRGNRESTLRNHRESWGITSRNVLKSEANVAWHQNSSSSHIPDNDIYIYIQSDSWYIPNISMNFPTLRIVTRERQEWIFDSSLTDTYCQHKKKQSLDGFAAGAKLSKQGIRAEMTRRLWTSVNTEQLWKFCILNDLQRMFIFGAFLLNMSVPRATSWHILVTS